MIKRLLGTACAAMLLLTMPACEDSTAEVVSKTKDVDTVEQLKKTLGDPADIAKAGPLAKWTYKTKDGTVTFLIAGEKVTTSMASTDEPEE